MVKLGHVVFYVRDLQRSLAFYRDVLGLQVVGEVFSGQAAALTGGSTHHELLLIQVGAAPGPPQGRRIGLYHVGWKIGDDLDALRRMLGQLEAAGVELDGMSDHTVSQSLYLRDPDGNEIELYVDDPGIDWRSDDSWLEQPVKRLRL